MGTAYCVRSDPINSLQVSETFYNISKPVGGSYNETFDIVGTNTDKTPARRGTNIQYNISPVPIDAVVTRAKIVLTADSTESSVFDSRIWRYKDGTTPNVDSTTETIHQQLKWLCRARDTASTQLAFAGASVTFDTAPETRFGNAAKGQVLVLAAGGNGSLGSVSMWMRRLSSPTGTCVAKVYSTSGTSSSYIRDTLLATSTPRNVSELTTAFTVAEFVFTLPTPLAVNAGDILIVDVSFSDTQSGSNLVFFGGDTGFDQAQENALDFGPSMQAFGPPVYTSGQELELGNGDRDAFGTASERFTFPSFVDGTQYSIGDTLYSPDVSLSNFTSWVQAGLDARGDNNVLSFSIIAGSATYSDPDPPASGEERRWRSAEHATPQIINGISFFGTVLVVEYEDPGGTVRAFPARARPAVAHGEVVARPAVSSPAVSRARLVVSSFPSRARVTVLHGEVVARPAVSAYAPRALAAVRAFALRVRSAVSHGEVAARPAVSSPTEARARAAVRTPEEARARPAINRGQTRARPTVRRP